MSHNTVETDTYSANIVVPDDGDNTVAASVETPFQQLANRTNHHEIDLTFLATGGRTATDGAKHIRRVANIAALQAIVGGAGLNGESAIVDALGLYVYSSSDATAADGNWIVAPSSGGGRWRHVLQGLLNAAQGLPRLDATTKIPAAQIPNRLVDELVASVTPNATSNNDQLDADTVAFQDFPAGSQITIPAGLVTDRIFAEVHFHARLTVAGHTALVRFECNGSQFGTLVINHLSSVYEPYHFISVEIAGSLSSRTLKLQAKIDNTTGSPILKIADPIIVRLRIIRP